VRRYRGARPAPLATARTVVLVDDGVATGVTAHAALRWLRGQQPRQLLMAAPVCSPQARDTLSDVADTIVCLHAPHRFAAVGQFYDDFAQLTDTDIDEALSKAQQSATN
jgi:predicted phosphoribosyltransferase